MYRLLTILISFLFTAHAMRASVAIPYVFVKNYTVDDYKASCQNWGFSLTPDTGKIIRQKHLPIADTDDVGIVHDGLMTMGAGLVLETVDLLLEGKTDAVPQEEFYKDPSELRPAPKIFKETCRIDWLQPVKRVYDFIRGLSPYPAAWTEIVSPEGVRTALKIYQAEKRPAAHELPVGTIRTDRKSYIDIAVEDGYLRLLSVQLAGKKRLPVTDFLNGFKQIGEYKVD